jgi:hypothetical protein
VWNFGRYIFLDAATLMEKTEKNQSNYPIDESGEK